MGSHIFEPCRNLYVLVLPLLRHFIGQSVHALERSTQRTGLLKISCVSEINYGLSIRLREADVKASAF